MGTNLTRVKANLPEVVLQNVSSTNVHIPVLKFAPLRLKPLVVQSTSCTSPGLNFNLLFWLVHYYSTIRFQTFQKNVLSERKYLCKKMFNFISKQLKSLIW